MPAQSGLEVERLVAWMDEAGLPGRGRPLHCSRLAAGSQNEVFEIRRGPLRCALRKPPPDPPPGRNEGILREWRIIEALEGTDVPHAEAIGVCPEPEVLGTPFYLMGFIDGLSLVGATGWPPPYDQDLEQRRTLALELVDAIARLSSVDWQAKGLGDLGHPEGFHDRQVDRWLKFLERIKTREIPGLETATEWLREHRPRDFVPGIMHGDYSFANVMFTAERPVRLAAIIDWEMTTIGDPKLDLAWALRPWPRDGDESDPDYFVDLTGMPSRAELVGRYAELTGRQMDDFDYYQVLAYWKHAIVLEQGYSRSLRGNPSPRLARFGASVLKSMQLAAELAANSSYAS